MESRKGYQIRLLIPVRLPRTRYVPDTSFKPSIEIGSEVLDPILRRVYLSPEFGLPAVALLSLLLVDAIFLVQSLFPAAPVRILLGKAVGSHPSGFSLPLLAACCELLGLFGFGNCRRIGSLVCGCLDHISKSACSFLALIQPSLPTKSIFSQPPWFKKP